MTASFEDDMIRASLPSPAGLKALRALNETEVPPLLEQREELGL